MSFLFNFPGAQWLGANSPDLDSFWPNGSAPQATPQAPPEGLLGKLSALLPGAKDMDPEDRDALIRQGLLAAGLGILRNNSGGNPGAAVGAGITEGLLAMNKGADQLADNRYRQQYMAQQMGEPTQFRALDAMARAAGHEPGSQGYKDFFRRANGEIARQSSAAIQYREVVGSDGIPRMVAFDPREVGAQVVGGNAGGYTIDPSLPPEVQAAIRASEQSGQPLPPQIDLAPVFPRQGSGVNPFAGRRAEDEAGAVEQARLAAQLQALPTQLGMQTNAAIQQAQGTAQATNAVEQAQAQRQRDMAMEQYRAAREGLQTGLAGTETGPIAGRLPAVTTGQQIAEGGVAAMAPVLKQLFRSAGEGVFTDRDQALLMEMLPTRKDTPEAAAVKLRNIDRIVQAKLAGQGPSMGSTGTGTRLRAGTVEDGYRFKGGNPADPRNWEQL